MTLAGFSQQLSFQISWNWLVNCVKISVLLIYMQSIESLWNVWITHLNFSEVWTIITFSFKITRKKEKLAASDIKLAKPYRILNYPYQRFRFFTNWNSSLDRSSGLDLNRGLKRRSRQFTSQFHEIRNDNCCERHFHSSYPMRNQVHELICVSLISGNNNTIVLCSWKFQNIFCNPE